MLPVENNSVFWQLFDIHANNINFGRLPQITTVFLVLWVFHGKIYITVFSTVNNSLFGYYMHIMQINAIWVFPNDKMVYLVTMSVS